AVELVEDLFTLRDQGREVAENRLHADLMLPFGQVEEERLVLEVEAEALHLVPAGVVEGHGLQLREGHLAVDEDAAVAEGAAVQVLLGLDGDLVEAVL